MKTVAEGLPDGVSVEWVDVYTLQMKPCAACMACRSEEVCVMPEDDAHRVGRMIREADGYIIGTPVHWGNMSAMLKLLLDRNVPVFMGESARGIPIPKQKGKRAVIVSACTTPWPFNFILPESRGAVRAVNEVLHTAGIKTVAKIIKPGARRNPTIGPRLTARARRAGQRLGRA
jgi:multimeric flavodoxin WrbA